MGAIIIKYKTKDDKIGEIRDNHFGTPMRIIEYRNVHDCDVEFQDDYKYVAKHVLYQAFNKGSVKNPYDKTVQGVGMLGEGKYMAKVNGEHTREYITWVNIMRRCYVAKEAFPAYYEISELCDEWLIMQNFAKWYEANWFPPPNNERIHIDKDILCPGNKLYSPAMCLIVPQSINMLFTNKSNETGLPNGITKTSNGQKFKSMYNHKHLGCFNTLEDAYTEYANEKEMSIKQKAEEYKSVIPTKLYNALLKYKVKYEYDKNYKG